MKFCRTFLHQVRTYVQLVAYTTMLQIHLCIISQHNILHKAIHLCTYHNLKCMSFFFEIISFQVEWKTPFLGFTVHKRAVDKFKICGCSLCTLFMQFCAIFKRITVAANVHPTFVMGWITNHHGSKSILCHKT